MEKKTLASDIIRDAKREALLWRCVSLAQTVIITYLVAKQRRQ